MNRGLRNGLRLGGVLLMLIGAAGANLMGADCASCHDQAQKLAKSAHADLTCDTCHESHDEYPHKAGVPKPACVT